MIRSVLLASLMIICVACASNAARSYSPNLADPATTSINLHVAVMPFEHYGCGRILTCEGHGLLAIVPGVLYARDIIIRNDARFAACLAADLSASNVFSAVDYVAEWDELRRTRKSYDVVITGTTTKDVNIQTTFAYGLSFPGLIFLPLLGLPSNAISRDVSMDIDVAFTDRPYRPVIKETLAFTGPSVFKGAYWFYDSPRRDSACPTEDLQPLFLKFRKQLQQSVLAAMSQAAGRDTK